MEIIKIEIGDWETGGSKVMRLNKSPLVSLVSINLNKSH